MQLHTVEPAYIPNQHLPLQLDWLLTLKCNYDCSYCPIDDSGHNNRIPHPPKDRCIKMLEYLYHYSDVVNSFKKQKSKLVILNVYGGEAVYHPDIEYILQKATELYQPYKQNWMLKRRLTTNATSGLKQWKNICNNIEGCTVSYHSEGPEKLKRNVKANILYLKEKKMDYDVQILLNNKVEYWNDIMDFHEWCQTMKIKYHLKILDGPTSVYNQQQLDFIKKYLPNNIEEGQVSRSQGRACCGGREMCFNRELKTRSKFVNQPESDFTGWRCSVNIFFLMANAVTGLFYSNKDCKVKHDGTLGHLATIDTMEDHIESFKEKLKNGYSGVTCVQKRCVCGVCAPKSKDLLNLKNILKHYLD